MDSSHPCDPIALWIPTGNSTANWSVKQVARFDSVEQFWAVFQHTISFQKLVQGQALYFFREGIKPEWEDPEHKLEGAGRLTLKMKRDQIEGTAAWEKILLAFVGRTWGKHAVAAGQIDVNTDTLDDCITGVAAQNYSHCDTIRLWLRNGTSEQQRAALSAALCHILSISSRTALEWRDFMQTSSQKLDG